jgi:hypothetical protein
VPQEYTTVQKKNLVVHTTDYQLITGHLYKMGIDIILQRYVLAHERPRILAESHEGIEGGHYAGKSTRRYYRIMVANDPQRLEIILSTM